MNNVRPLLAALPFCCLVASAGDWPAWRGPLGTGVCDEKNLPTVWGTNQNVRWRVALPEPGNSTPIVWGDRVFVTQPVGDRRTLMCFQRSDGKLLWQAGVTTREQEPTHKTNPYCSASPVTDGERVIASFASDGLYCFDFAGKELWRRTDLGRQIHMWGNGASPLLAGNLCILNFGPGITNYLLAVDKRTGRTVWRHDEPTTYGQPNPATRSPNYIGSWSTPVLMNNQLLMSWPHRLAAYEPATGRELWSSAGLSPLCYTSPIHGDGIAVAFSGFGGAALAVRAGGERVWSHPRSPQRIGSGVVHDGHIYIHNGTGSAMCLDLRTGATNWIENLPGGANWSSVMLADGNCYTLNQQGNGCVFKASPTFALVAINRLGEPSNSSIVPSAGELFIRTHKALWCIRAGR
jgi:outer membrane protein assembly factor BamB